MTKLRQLLNQGVKLNNTDNQARYVYYTDGGWKMEFRLPADLDHKTFYVIEHGSSHAVCL